MSTLSNYANASAGGREERIAKIFGFEFDSNSD